MAAANSNSILYGRSLSGLRSFASVDKVFPQALHKHSIVLQARKTARPRGSTKSYS